MNRVAETEEKTISPQSQVGLVQTIRGGPLVFVKYALFAQQARRNGREELAILFGRTAQVKLLEHFAEVAELAWLVSDDYADVCNAIRSSSYEVDQMYREIAELSAVSDDDDAARFAAIGRDGMEHGADFNKALQELEAGRQTNVDMVTA